jgi:hypothetical protein
VSFESNYAESAQEHNEVQDECLSNRICPSNPDAEVQKSEVDFIETRKATMSGPTIEASLLVVSFSNAFALHMCRIGECVVSVRSVFLRWAEKRLRALSGVLFRNGHRTSLTKEMQAMQQPARLLASPFPQDIVFGK